MYISHTKLYNLYCFCVHEPIVFPSSSLPHLLKCSYTKFTKYTFVDCSSVVSSEGF